MKLNLIAAACGPELGIGNKGQLPWRLKGELNYFSRMTIGDGSKKNVVVMGRKTWMSIPPKMKPLSNRFNVVLSRQEGYDPKQDVPQNKNKDDVILCKSLEDAMETVSQNTDLDDNIWIIGGSDIYKAAMESQFCHRVYLTEIAKSFECDTFFPNFNKSDFNEVTDTLVPQEEQCEDGVTYKFKIYEKIEI